MENQQQQSTDKRNADQLVEPVLNLSHSTRGQLITCLDMLSAVLQCNKPIPDDAKQRICQKIDESIRLLIELSPFKSVPSGEPSNVFEEMISGQLTVALSVAERMSAVGHLISARGAVQFGVLTANDQTKRCLLAENRKIVVQLMDLQYQEKGPEPDEEKNKKNGESTESPESPESTLEQQLVNAEISSPNEEIDKLKTVVESQKEQMSGLKTSFDEQISEIKRGLKRKIEEVNLMQIDELKKELQIEKVDANRSSVSFKFELCNVTQFFGIRDSVKYSDRFWCKGMQWSIFVANNSKPDQSKHLGFFLRCHNDDPQKWSCKTNGKLILFDNMSKNQHKVRPFDHLFQNVQSLGHYQFISYHDLKNGYIMADDKIVVGVELNAGPVVRRW